MKDFITNSWSWDVDKLRSYVCEEDVQVISIIPISCAGGTDRWVWHYIQGKGYGINYGNYKFHEK